MNNNPSEVVIKIKPKTILIYLSVPIVFLSIAHILGQFAAFNIIHGFRGDYFISLFFNLDNEASIPTLYVLIEWFCCIVLLTLITLMERKEYSRYLYWLGLTIIFSFLTIDEFISIHEILSEQKYFQWNASGLFYYSWIIPYVISLIVLCLVYLKFLLNLSKKTRNCFVTSFLVFMLGAVVTEALGGRYVEIYGSDKYYFLCFVTVEETLEMIGLLIFIYALASYIVDELGISQIQVK